MVALRSLDPERWPHYLGEVEQLRDELELERDRRREEQEDFDMDRHYAYGNGDDA